MWPYLNTNVMNHSNKTIIILLNVLFCAILLWFFTRNAFLRPYLGSKAKEFLSGLFLLVTVYANYFILYPKLYRSHAFIYWSSVIIASLVISCVEFALGYSFMLKCNAMLIHEVGSFLFFYKYLLFVFGRNIAFNFFPFVLREREQLQQSLDTEVKVVYQYARMLDVCDDKNNCQHISIDNIFYCKKYGNETEVHTVDGAIFTRYCTIKYLTQLFGDKEFVRISRSFIVPFRHIASCDGKTVVMKTMPWTEIPVTFKLDTQRYTRIAATINEYLHANIRNTDDIQPDIEKGKKNPSVPPKDKLDAVFNYIQAHPGCRSTEIISHTSYSQTTMERCISELKKQGLIEHTGSRKLGGYFAVES